MSERIRERDEERSLRKYFMAFQDAWQDFLKALEKGEFDVIYTEKQLMCLLFAKCLEVMHRRKFEKPYKISVEFEEKVERTRADIALGFSGNGRFVAVEIKNFPSVEEIKGDIQKLQGYVEGGLWFGFFVMIGDSKDEYRTNLNFKELGIQQEIPENYEASIRLGKSKGETSFYQWKLVTPPYGKRPLETLIVGLGSP